MRGHKTWMTRLGWGLALLALLSSPAFADAASVDAAADTAGAVDVVYSGADVWNTTSGMTVSDFSNDPIPADFFCEGSRPFDGRVELHGVPLVTDPPGFLGSADTVVHRLDDATFDENGVATTRLKFMALSLASTEPIDVGCNYPFDVVATLDDGDQPVSEMVIFRETDSSGIYMAPLELRVKVSFVPFGSAEGEMHTIARDISLGPGTHSIWTTTARVGRTAFGEPVRVDTDMDGIADSSFPGFSNFNPGYALVEEGVHWWTNPPPSCPCGQCVNTTCHCNPDSCDPNEPNEDCSRSHMHCVYTCGPCGNPISRCEIDDEPGIETL